MPISAYLVAFVASLILMSTFVILFVLLVQLVEKIHTEYRAQNPLAHSVLLLAVSCIAVFIYNASTQGFQLKSFVAFVGMICSLVIVMYARTALVRLLGSRL